MGRMVALGALLTTALTAQTVLHAGTWQMNVSKSKFDPGPAPGYSARFDGTDHPATGSPAYDSIALTRVDANTFDAVLKLLEKN